MGFRPLFSLRPTNISRAFVLNAILLGFTTALTIEVRRVMDETRFTKDLPDIPHKVFATALISIVIGFFSYVIIRALFGLGGAMIAPKRPYPYFF